MKYWKSGRGAAFGSVCLAALLLGGCASLPVSGPTGAQVLRDARAGDVGAGDVGAGDARAGDVGAQATGHMPFRLVELGDMGSLPPAPALPVVGPLRVNGPSDAIGPGDVLDIEIYEAGVTLFGGHGAGGTGGGADGVAPAARAEHLPAMRVDDGGFVRLPYVGQLRASGQTPAALAAAIRAGLARLSENPQVVVSVARPVANTVILGGEVGRPGRLVLDTNQERLSDAVALAGGYRGEAKDLAVRVVRDGRAMEYRLDDVLSGPARDMGVAPGDRIEVVRAPLTFAVMGAPGKVEQMAFPAASVSLAEAVAMAGGAHPYLGDAKAIFVFRFEADAGGGEHQVVYHLDMMRAGAYFLSQRFVMRDKDLLYVGNAAANQPGKLIQLISQLFSPIMAVEGGLVSAGTIR